jgi:hypothetical protein
MSSKYIKEPIEADKTNQPLKTSKTAFKLIKNENWQPLRKTKKPIRVIIEKDLPPTAA